MRAAAKRAKTAVSSKTKAAAKAVSGIVAREKARRFEGTVVRYDQLPAEIRGQIDKLKYTKTAKIFRSVLGFGCMGAEGLSLYSQTGKVYSAYWALLWGAEGILLYEPIRRNLHIGFLETNLFNTFLS